MAAATKGPSAAVEHADKIALGLGVLVMVGMIAASVLTGGDTQKIDKAGEQIKSIEAQVEVVDGSLPEATLERSPREDFRRQLRQKFDTAKIPAWSAHARPIVLREVEAKVTTQVICVHEAPILNDPKVERGKITLSWEDDKDSNAKIDIVEYHVYRSENLDDPTDPASLDAFKVIKKLPGKFGVVEWPDESVVPELRYAYYVRSLAEASQTARDNPGGHSFPLADREKASRVTDNVVTPSNHQMWLNKVTAADPDFPDPDVDQIEFFVQYWDAATNAWGRKKSFRGLVGDPDTAPFVIGEGPYETQWHLFSVGADDTGQKAPDGNPVYKRWAEVRHKTTREVKKYMEGEKPPE